MEKLTPWQQSNQKEIEERLAVLLGTFVDDSGKQQTYFAAFNHDLAVINQLLEHPPSEYAQYQKAYEYQEEYNRAMDIAKLRWEKGQKTFDIGKTIVKDLTTRKKQYEDSIERLAIVEQKQKEMNTFSDDNETTGEIKPTSPWSQLHILATQQDQADLDKIPESLRVIAKKLDIKDKGDREKRLDEMLILCDSNKHPQDFKKSLIECAQRLDNKNNKNRVALLHEIFSYFAGRGERLRQLRVEWQAQGQLVHAATADLIRIKNELDNFQALIELIENKLPDKNLSRVDQEIKKQLSENQKKLANYQRQIEAAAIWRIKGAVQYGNLRLDDALFVLKREFSQTVFQFDEPAIIAGIANIASIPVDSISFGSNFKLFHELHKWLVSGANVKDQPVWLKSRWVTDPDKRNLIPVVVKAGAVIPQVVAVYCPEKSSYWPGEWLRYWFFRTEQSLTGFAGWLRKIWVGVSFDTLMLINETYRHVDKFEKTLRENKARGNGVNLLLIGESIAFLDALEIPEYIAFEKERAKNLLGSSNLWDRLRWLPFLKFSTQATFKNTWLKELDRAEEAIKDKAGKIASFIMEDFEALLLDSIEKKCFLLPADLLRNIEKFIHYYGSKEDLIRLDKMASPIYLISQFRFLQAPTENGFYRKIDEDNVTAFLHYAEKYFTAEQTKAVKLVVGMITRDSLPKNINEDKIIFDKIKCLFTEPDKQTAFNNLMAKIAREYIFTTGDDGHDECYQFLKRFASDAARTWQMQRCDNMDEKFIFINNLLSIEPGQEKDLCSDEVQSIGSSQFVVNNYARYLKDIIKADTTEQMQRIVLLQTKADQYVAHYTGDNLRYALLLFVVNSKSLNTFLTTYCEKRFDYMLQQMRSNRSMLVDTQEQNFICQLKRYPVLVARLAEKIEVQSDIQGDALNEWIKCCDEPQITAAYFGKRFCSDLINNRFEVLSENDAFYKSLMPNSLFNQRVHDALTEKIRHSVQQGQWRGDIQYFVEQYAPPENPALKYEVRLQWLEWFLSSFKERSTRDGKYHFNNKQIPNDRINLATFFGEENLPKVRECIMRRLDSFDEKLSDEVIHLIGAYFRDPAFNLQTDWPLFRKKRDFFQTAQQIIHCLKNGVFIDGVTQLANFYAQMQGMQALASTEQNTFHQPILHFQQQLFEQVLQTVRGVCCELFVNQGLIENSLNTQEREVLERQQKSLHDFLSNTNLPLGFKQSIHLIYSERHLCIDRLKALLASLTFSKMQDIQFDLNDLQLLSSRLCNSTKDYLKLKIKALQDYLPPNDPLFGALAACYRIIRDEYVTPEAKAVDRETLSAYQVTVQNYPRLAEDMAARIIVALQAHEELTYFPLFKDTRVSYQNSFMHYLTKTTQQQLLHSLQHKIEWILLHSDPSQAQYARVDWSYHAQLLIALQQIDASGNHELNQALAGWNKSCMNDVDKLLKSLLEDLDKQLSAKTQMIDPTVKKKGQLSVHEREQQLIKCALFVRTFGDVEQHVKLDKLINEVVRRQHLAMMKGISDPLIEHSLDFADKFISTAGSLAQREQCAQLADTWHLYRSQPQPAVLQSVRVKAVSSSIPQYIESFEQALYSYFIKKHNLPERFAETMSNTIYSWDLQEALLEPERILKKHPLTAFQEILQQAALNRAHGFFYTKPTLQDGCKLFVAFCLNIQAKQLAKIWQNRQLRLSQSDVDFDPAVMSGSLIEMVNQLAKKYDIGRGEFNKSLSKAIAKDGEYFASWSVPSVVMEGSKRASRLIG